MSFNYGLQFAHYLFILILKVHVVWGCQSWCCNQAKFLSPLVKVKGLSVRIWCSNHLASKRRLYLKIKTSNSKLHVLQSIAGCIARSFPLEHKNCPVSETYKLTSTNSWQVGKKFFEPPSSNLPQTTFLAKPTVNMRAVPYYSMFMLLHLPIPRLG